MTIQIQDRIQELAEQAKQQVPDGLDVNAWIKCYNEKFAELIVKECGQTLVDNTPVTDLKEDWDKGYDRAMNDCIHHIYEHFGVES